MEINIAPNGRMMTPSILAHLLNGGLLFVAIVFIIMHYNKLIKLSEFNLIILILALSISAGIHGLSHIGLEYVYGYNPLTILHT